MRPPLGPPSLHVVPARAPERAPEPAGSWMRAAAGAIDALALVVGTALLLFPIDVASLAPGVDPRAAAALKALSIGGRFLLAWLYFAWMESSERRATLGKIALGLEVLDRSGAPLDFRRASLRLGSKLLSAAPLGLGLFLAAFTPGKRALHDLVAGSAVVRRGRPSGAGIGVAVAVVALLAAFATPNLLETHARARWIEAVARDGRAPATALGEEP